MPQLMDGQQQLHALFTEEELDIGPVACNHVHRHVNAPCLHGTAGSVLVSLFG